MIQFNLCCILLILVVLLIFKVYLQHTNVKYYNKLQTYNLNNTNNTNHKNNKNNTNNEDLQQLLQKVKLDTNKKINQAIEQGMIEGFQAMQVTQDINTVSSNTNNNIISYINKYEEIKLLFFYKTSCSYCSDFLPIWYQIVNNLPNNIIYEEINVDKNNENNKYTNEYNITSVPTLILLKGKTKEIYMGKRTYKEIELFLKKYGINLESKSIEDFDDTGYGTDPMPSIATNPNCPAVTFDTNVYLENDEHMFQIFNSEGQYGYATGGYKEGKMLKPFQAAYSVLDSYLSSIPDTKNMTECATLYSKDIRGFGLCDTEQLDDILSYQNNVKNGSKIPRLPGTDYSTNNNVVNAIKTACEL